MYAQDCAQACFDQWVRATIGKLIQVELEPEPLKSEVTPLGNGWFERSVTFGSYGSLQGLVADPVTVQVRFLSHLEYAPAIEANLSAVEIIIDGCSSGGLYHLRDGQPILQ